MTHTSHYTLKDDNTPKTKNGTAWYLMLVNYFLGIIPKFGLQSYFQIYQIYHIFVEDNKIGAFVTAINKVDFRSTLLQNFYQKRYDGIFD